MQQDIYTKGLFFKLVLAEPEETIIDEDGRDVTLPPIVEQDKLERDRNNYSSFLLSVITNYELRITNYELV